MATSSYTLKLTLSEANAVRDALTEYQTVLRRNIISAGGPEAMPGHVAKLDSVEKILRDL